MGRKPDFQGIYDFSDGKTLSFAIWIYPKYAMLSISEYKHGKWKKISNIKMFAKGEKEKQKIEEMAWKKEWR